jgi:hypothetical protein
MSRIGRLQRACRRTFLAAAASELPTSALMVWARPRGVTQTWQREEVCRAAKRWAVRVRREGREWVWRLRDGQPPGEDDVAQGSGLTRMRHFWLIAGLSNGCGYEPA